MQQQDSGMAEDKDGGSGRAGHFKKLHEKRVKKGECPQCGIKLFKISGVLGKKKIPITTEGHVDNGRCLACDPDTTSQVMSAAQRTPSGEFPSGIDPMATLKHHGATASDSATVISGITMDQHLLQSGMTADIGEVDDDITKDAGEALEVSEGTGTPATAQTPPIDHMTQDLVKAEVSPSRKSQISAFPRKQLRGSLGDCQPDRSSTRTGDSFRGSEDPSIAQRLASDRLRLETSTARFEKCSDVSPPPPGGISPGGRGAAELHSNTEQQQPNFVLRSPRPGTRRSNRNLEMNTVDTRQQEAVLRAHKEAGDISTNNSDVGQSPRTVQSSSLTNPASSTEPSFQVAAPKKNERKGIPSYHEQQQIQEQVLMASAMESHMAADAGADASAAFSLGNIPAAPAFVANIMGANPLVTPKQRRPTIVRSSLRLVASGKHTSDEEETKTSVSAEGYDPYRLQNLLKLLVEQADAQSNDNCFMGGITDDCIIEAIANQLYKGGKQAKEIFRKYHGYESLTQIMWSHMVHEPLEESAVNLFLATVASEDNGEGDDFETASILATDEARNAMEACLFVMQSLSHNKNIQMMACRALVCLATASGLSQGKVDDGSNSGAAAVVVNAMSAHRGAVLVQKWSLRALYELCTVSVHAESNKRSVLAAYGGAYGLGAMIVELLVQFPPVVEAVRLIWCLSASEEARGALDIHGSSLLSILIQMLRDNTWPSSDAVLLEPLLAAISNILVIVEGGKARSNRSIDDLARLALEAAMIHGDNVGLCTEAVALIANVASLGLIDKNAFVHRGGVSFLADLIINKDDAEALHEECACALLSLSMNSDRVKAAVRIPQTFAAIKRMSRLYESSVKWQEILCSLISSVVATTDSNALECEKDAIGAICFAMTLYTGAERVQEASCVALQNISSRENVRNYLIESDAIQLIVDAIARHNQSKAIVLHGCEALWNAGFCGRDYPQVSKPLMAGVLSNMRCHLDDVELMHSALGVLLRCLVGSDDNKRGFCDANGLEVATSVILIHRGAEELLIKACGLLASLTCLSELVPAVVKAGGIRYTIDTMRDQSQSTALLTSAAHVLTNTVLAMPDQCDEVGSIASVLIERMRESPKEAQFQIEACRLIWALASLSGPVRSRILDLDGAAVLMATLEHNKEPDVQTNALEAFNELALSSEVTT